MLNLMKRPNVFYVLERDKNRNREIYTIEEQMKYFGEVLKRGWNENNISRTDLANKYFSCSARVPDLEKIIESLVEFERWEKKIEKPFYFDSNRFCELIKDVTGDDLIERKCKLNVLPTRLKEAPEGLEDFDRFVDYLNMPLLAVIKDLHKNGEYLLPKNMDYKDSMVDDYKYNRILLVRSLGKVYEEFEDNLPLESVEEVIRLNSNCKEAIEPYFDCNLGGELKFETILKLYNMFKVGLKVVKINK